MKHPVLVNVGKVPHDGTGDTISVAARKISDNLLEIIRYYDSNYLEIDKQTFGTSDVGWRDEFILINNRFEKIFELLSQQGNKASTESPYDLSQGNKGAKRAKVMTQITHISQKLLNRIEDANLEDMDPDDMADWMTDAYHEIKRLNSLFYLSCGTMTNCACHWKTDSEGNRIEVDGDYIIESLCGAHAELFQERSQPKEVLPVSKKEKTYEDALEAICDMCFNGATGSQAALDMQNRALKALAEAERPSEPRETSDG